MRNAYLIALALAAATASAARADDDAAKRKGAPDKFLKAAGEAFVEAVTADKAGDLKTALGLYTKAFAISPHPSTAYNIADVHRRLLAYTDAIKWYETYLALAPAAADRRDVEAVLEKLARTPGTLLLVTGEPSDPNAADFKSAYVLVDGDIKIRPGTAPGPLPGFAHRTGLAIAVPPGKHVVDLITPLTHGHQTCNLAVGANAFCTLSAKPRIDGHLVVNSSDRNLGARLEPKGRSIAGQRVEAPPGKLRLSVRDRGYQCAPVLVDVPGGNDLAYVFLSTDEYTVERCRRVDARVHRLRFTP